MTRLPEAQLIQIKATLSTHVTGHKPELGLSLGLDLGLLRQLQLPHQEPGLNMENTFFRHRNF